RRRQGIEIEHLAIGGVFAVERLAVPGGDAGLVIGPILGRVIPDAIDLIGVADLVAAMRAVALRAARPACAAAEQKRRHGKAQDEPRPPHTPAIRQSTLSAMLPTATAK